MKHKKRRPRLKPGDVCVLSKRGKKRFRFFGSNDTFVVLEVGAKRKSSYATRARYEISRHPDDGMCSILVARKLKTARGYRWWKTHIERRNLYLAKRA